MKATWESFKIALGALRANKVRSLLTTLGIVIGITTIIAIVAIVAGLNQAFANELSAIGRGVLYVQKFPWASHDWQKYRGYPDIGWDEYDAIAADAKLVDGLSPMKYWRDNVKWRSNKMENIEILGVNEQYALIRNVFPAIGRNFGRLDVIRGRNVCVIGHEVADRLFGMRSPVGKRVRLGRDSFQVIGVIEKRGDFFDQNLDKFVLIPHTTFAKTMYNSRRGMSIVVKVRAGASIADAKDEIRVLLRRVRKLPLTTEDNFSINEVDVLKELYDKLTGGLFAAMFAVAGISLLVGGIGIMNIMLVSVTERTREIGIRKALGARRRWIMLQFLFEAAVLASVGGAIGVACGAGVARLVAATTPLPAVVETWSVIVGIVFSSAVGIFFGIFPARAAARKDPIEALRYE